MHIHKVTSKSNNHVSELDLYCCMVITTPKNPFKNLKNKTFLRNFK